jgi:hypothetical protein
LTSTEAARRIAAHIGDSHKAAMAKHKSKRRKRTAVPRPRQEPRTAPRPPAGLILRRIAAVLIAATLGSSLLAYFIPPPPSRRVPQASAWSQTHANRLWRTVRLWGLTRDQKRAAGSWALMGGDVFRFTQLWAGYLDERLMPQTKCWDHTREDHIRYLLPNTGRRKINPPPGPDRRPPVVVGYRLEPVHLAVSACALQAGQTGTITLDDGHRLGQSFVTDLDFDLLNEMVLFAPRDAALPVEGYTATLYSGPDKRRVLAETHAASPLRQGALGGIVLSFEPPVRLTYGRGATPYLVEVAWRRPADYTGPAPVFHFADDDPYKRGDMYVDGARRPGSDLAFSIGATHTDVTGYTLVLSLHEPRPGEKWPPYFVAVRDDVLRLAGPREPGESLADFFDRLNKVLLEL